VEGLIHFNMTQNVEGVIFQYHRCYLANRMIYSGLCYPQIT